MKQYRLLTHHTHNGIYLLPGSVIELDEPTAKWCIEQGVVSSDLTYPTKTEVPPPASTLPNGGRAEPVHRVRNPTRCAGCGW